MPQEIERKFLVDRAHPELKAILASPGMKIRQGYITDHSLIRLEIAKDAGTLQVDYGRDGTSSYCPSIPATDAREIIDALCVPDGDTQILENGVARLRVTDDKAWLTLKGFSSGISRLEYEYEVPVALAAAILDASDADELRKCRHLYPLENGLCVEVDVFEHLDLILAEIELPSEDADFPKPEWFGAEVSEDPDYYNSNLAKRKTS